MRQRSALDKKIGERLEVFDSTSGQLKTEIELDQPGRLTYDPQGKLHAVSADNVVQVDRAAASTGSCSTSRRARRYRL